MREPEDVLRSCRRYVASAMGSPPWRVRLAMDSRFKRPFALLSTPAPRTHVQDSQAALRATLPLVVQLYPDTPGSGPMRATEARLLAERAAEQLTFALSVGVVDAQDPAVRGYPGRIPLWDYHDEAGNPLALEGDASVATRRFAMDYLWLADGWTVHVQPEAGPDELFVALANLRVQWWRATALRPAGTVLQSVAVETTGHVAGEAVVDVQASDPGS